MGRALGWGMVVAALGLALAGNPAEAADPPYRETMRRHVSPRRGYHRPIYPAIGLACDEGWGDTVILRCRPDQIRVRPDEDDLDAWNAFTGLDEAQHRPYRQLFTWSR